MHSVPKVSVAPLCHIDWYTYNGEARASECVSPSLAICGVGVVILLLVQYNYYNSWRGFLVETVQP